MDDVILIMKKGNCFDNMGNIVMVEGFWNDAKVP